MRRDLCRADASESDVPETFEHRSHFIVLGMGMNQDNVSNLILTRIVQNSDEDNRSR